MQGIHAVLIVMQGQNKPGAQGLSVRLHTQCAAGSSGLARQRTQAHRPRQPWLLRLGGEPKFGSHSPLPSTFKEHIMNKDQVKGQVKDIAGKVQAETGKLVGSTAQHVKGLKLQVEGQVQESLGDAKELVKEAHEAVKAAVRSEA